MMVIAPFSAGCGLLAPRFDDLRVHLHCYLGPSVAKLFVAAEGWRGVNLSQNGAKWRI